MEPHQGHQSDLIWGVGDGVDLIWVILGLKGRKEGWQEFPPVVFFFFSKEGWLNLILVCIGAIVVFIVNAE